MNIFGVLFYMLQAAGIIALGIGTYKLKDDPETAKKILIFSLVSLIVGWGSCGCALLCM